MPTHAPNRQSPGFWTELFNSFRLAWQLLRDDQVPLVVKLVPFAALLYILSPVDFIPDALLGLGQLDDLAILLLALQIFIALTPRHVVQRYRRDAAEAVGNSGWRETGRRRDTDSGASREIIDD